MTTYAEITAKVADQWVAAFKGAEDSLATWVKGAQKATAKLDIPTFPVPEQIAKLNEAFSEQLPKPSEIVQANFELVTRLLTAQRDFALRLLEVGASADARAPEAAAPEATATKKTTKA